MKKARVYLLLGLVVLCSACAAPSLRYKTEVNRLAAAGKFEEAEKHIVSKQNKMYAKKLLDSIANSVKSAITMGINYRLLISTVNC